MDHKEYIKKVLGGDIVIDKNNDNLIDITPPSKQAKKSLKKRKRKNILAQWWSELKTWTKLIYSVIVIAATLFGFWQFILYIYKFL